MTSDTDLTTLLQDTAALGAKAQAELRRYSVRDTARQILAAVVSYKGLTFTPEPMVREVVRVAKALEGEFEANGV